MNDAQNIFRYISFFRQIKAITIHQWRGGQELEPGVIQMPYPEYHPVVYRFFEDVHNSPLCDTSYGETIEKYGFSLDYEKLRSAVPTADAHPKGLSCDLK